MAKPVKKGNQKEAKREKGPAKPQSADEFFTDKNRIIIGVGIIVVILGLYALAQPPVDGFITMTVAPFLLVVGFLVIIPLGILWRKKKKDPGQATKGD